MDANKVGARLRDLRGDRKISEVCNDIGVCRSALSMYETGKRIPRDEIKIRIANYYKRGVGEIFYKEDQ